MNVLIVEDNAIDSTLARVLLEMSGHEVDVVDSAEAAMSAIELKSPDAVLLDMQLPGLSGLGLARVLRADARSRPIAILAISAYPEMFPTAQQIAAGCDVFIAKPFDTRTLVGQLEQVARSKAGASGGPPPLANR